MSVLIADLVPLDRTFCELKLESDGDEDAELLPLINRRGALHWADLLREHRVVLLSEAGSGKTTEIRNTARALIALGKPAFFLRIEHISANLSIAFEEGTHEDFLEWLASGHEGWLFLDSVDEARLRHPRDFEVAIKTLSQKLKPVLNDVHIVITARTSAWKVRTDLMLCRTSFPFQPETTEVSSDQSAEGVQTSTVKKDDKQSSNTFPFRFFSLEDLHGYQVSAFLHAMDVSDHNAFLAQVEQMDAGFLTTRPLDLIELIEYWKANERIGSRYDLMLSSIDRRLQEHDQDRLLLQNMTPAKLRHGARLIAAAATLCQQSAIQTPDGTYNDLGIAIKDVLPEWTDADRQTLLERPIFDEVIYGSVRFHHRSVREYLTAEWLAELLKKGTSRRQIEGLFFRTQYGIEVVVPVMRPVLAWLIILDERILDRARKLSPEVVFEGGDPSRLPLSVRCLILRQACEQLAQPAHGRTLSDFSSIKRFAAPDLTQETNTLLAKYRDDEDITWFLLVMVWHGQMEGAVDLTLDFALHSHARYTRIAAFRALAAIGTEKNRTDVRAAILQEGDGLDRNWVAELVLWLSPNHEALTWLVEAVKQAAPANRYHVDSLAHVLSKQVADWSPHFLGALITEMAVLMDMAPCREAYPSRLSKRYRWLAVPSVQIMLTMVNKRDMSAINESSLALLRKLPMFQQAGELDGHDAVNALHGAVRDWPELNQTLFWYDVACTRAYMASEAFGGHSVTLFSQIGSFGHLWSFAESDFESACEYIAMRELPDDKSVALTLAFSLYRSSEQAADRLQQISDACAHDEDLQALLQNLLNPPAIVPSEWTIRHERWQRKAARRNAVHEGRKRQWKDRLQAETSLLRASATPGEMNNSQLYMLERLGKLSKDSGNWSDAPWQGLIPGFGEGVASAFRDGAVSFWRDYEPHLRSEGAPDNSTPYSVIFGLVGLAIEATEDAGWLDRLSHAQAVRATRYALHELNGFPAWLPSLYLAFPEAVLETLLREIDFELATKKAETQSSYVLYDLSWSGDWGWDGLAPSLIQRLKSTPKNVKRLRQMLSIIQGSSQDDTMLASLASGKAKATKDTSIAPLWFAMWVGVDPRHAIATLAARLISIADEVIRTRFAMIFITALMGSRRERPLARDAHRTVTHMKDLYLLMNTYIREEDDIQRANSGVYSPELRDDAQDARNALHSFIRGTPGKEAFFALMEISKHHPASHARPWMAFQAKEKAILDADMTAWSPHQVCDFNDRQERTPTTPRDLWDLAVEVLLDVRHDLEDGDSSPASIFKPAIQETEIRKFIGNACRDRARGRYSVPQEEQFADDKRADLRFHGSGFEAQIPVELKLADKWTGPRLLERLENQLCGDYMRDRRSSYGIFLLVYHGKRADTNWVLSRGKTATTFETLIEALQLHWMTLAPHFPEIEDIRVIGIDLTKRGIDAQTPSRKRARRAADPDA